MGVLAEGRINEGRCCSGYQTTWFGATLKDCTAGSFCPGEASYIWLSPSWGGCSFCGQSDYYPQIPCPSGTFSGNRSSTCTSCVAGKYSENQASYCSTCPAGKASSRSSRSCSDCGNGKYSQSDEASICSKCDAGRFSGSGAQSSCTACPKGKTSSAESSNCTDCTSGRYNDQEGAPKCQACPLGKVNPNSGGSDKQSCAECEAGKYSDIHNHVTSAHDPRTECKICEAGSYAEAGFGECQECDSGKTASDFKTGATSLSDLNCVTCLCPFGTICHPTCVGEFLCSPCPAGKYGRSLGAKSCTACDYGKWSR